MALKDLQLVTKIENSDSVKFSFSKRNGMVVGKDSLVQRLIYRILTLKGSNLFDPNVGTNFTILLGTISTSEIEEAKETIPAFIEDLQQQVLAEQTTDNLNSIVLQDDEQLESLELKNVEFDPIFGGWILTIIINTKANNSITIRV